MFQLLMLIYPMAVIVYIFFNGHTDSILADFGALGVFLLICYGALKEVSDEIDRKRQ